MEGLGGRARLEETVGLEAAVQDRGVLRGREAPGLSEEAAQEELVDAKVAADGLGGLARS